MKEELIKKYELYISNLNWYIDVNKPSVEEKEVIKSKIWIYEEIIRDLKTL